MKEYETGPGTRASNEWMRKASHMRTCLAICALLWLTIPGSAKPTTAPSESRPVAIDVPFRAWAITSCDEGVLIFGYGRVDKATQSAPEARGGKQLELCAAELIQPGGQAAPVRLSWRSVSVLNPLFPKVPPQITSMRNSALRKTLVAVVLHGGGSRMLFMAWVSDSRARPQKRGKRPRRSAKTAEEDSRIEWWNVRRVDYWGAPKDFFISDLRCPSIGFLKTRTFIAGESFYPRSQDRGVWVAPVGKTRGRRLKGTLLGKGRRPVLATWNNQLFCFAIAPAGGTRSARGREPGRVIGWASKDGNNWKRLDFELKPTDVFLLDACVGPDGLYLGCASNPASPSLRILRFGKNLREPDGEAVLDVNKERDLRKKKTVLSNLNVRMVGDKLALFWEEKLLGGPKQIVIEYPTFTAKNTEAGAKKAKNVRPVSGLR